MKHITLGLMAAALSVAGCETYTPILDGPESATYQSDLQACQILAANQKRFDHETLGAAVAGGLLGAIVANHDGSATELEGLLGGALVAYAMASFEATEARSRIVVTCMQGRGHRVVG